jgi:hypothetical protein
MALVFCPLVNYYLAFFSRIKFWSSIGLRQSCLRTKKGAIMGWASEFQMGFLFLPIRVPSL